VPDPTLTRWVTVRIDVPAAAADLVAGLLWAAGVAGIEERPSSADPDGGVELRAGAEARVLDAVHATIGDRWPVEVEGVEGDAWLDEWRHWAQAWRAGGRLVVAPTWLGLPDWVGADDVVVHLDPGRAFGSGAHVTTRLCLAELEARVRLGDDVLDVGCGSGVLAVAAASLGSRPVVAVDVDEDAVRATAEVAAANGLDGVVGVSRTPVGDLSGTHELVLANLLLPVVVDLAADLVRLTAPGGRLVVSGLLDNQVQRAVAELGLPVERTTRLDGWACVRLRP
jgi:ribosomal protein L11 methyltransferase